MPASVDALLPLSLLEAVRDIDTPEGDFETEFVPELRNKRFGLSETVYAQIRRYTEAVRRHQPTTYDEAVALARLIGRRPDAEAVFREAGRLLARASYVTVSPLMRRVLRVAPGLLMRPIALRRARRIARRYLNGTMSRRGSTVLLEVPASVTADAAARAAGCAYYESSLGEILRLLTGASGSVEHVRCSARGEGSCQWRADWAR
jgi:predicted hydrocarbon binding protein